MFDLKPLHHPKLFEYKNFRPTVKTKNKVGLSQNAYV